MLSTPCVSNHLHTNTQGRRGRKGQEKCPMCPGGALASPSTKGPEWRPSRSWPSSWRPTGRPLWKQPGATGGSMWQDMTAASGWRRLANRMWSGIAWMRHSWSERLPPRQQLATEPWDLEAEAPYRVPERARKGRESSMEPVFVLIGRMVPALSGTNADLPTSARHAVGSTQQLSAPAERWQRARGKKQGTCSENWLGKMEVAGRMQGGSVATGKNFPIELTNTLA